MGVPLKHWARLVTECFDAGELPLITLDQVDSGGGRLATEALTVTPMPLAGAALVQPGDVLYGKLRPYLAKSYRVSTPAYASTELMAIRPTGHLDPRFLSYLVRSRPFVEWTVATSEGTKMPRTSWEKVGSFTVESFPLQRQRAIADYLDTETARIDALITKKRHLAAVIGERAAAATELLLTSAATRQVPLRRLLAEPPMYGAGESGLEGEDDWPRYIRITDLDEDGELRFNNVLRLPPDVARPYLLRDGDLLLARSGATVGKAFIYQGALGACAFAGYLIRFRPDPDAAVPQLLRAWTRTSHYWSQVKLAALQATIENVSADKYKDFLVPLPPLSAQADLVRVIGLQEERSKAVVRRLTHQITLLSEHRQALITAAVSGELEVPGVAA